MVSVIDRSQLVVLQQFGELPRIHAVILIPFLQQSISIAVRNAAGKIVMECVIETKAGMILEFIEGLRGDVHVTFEEGTWAAWLYDLLKPHVSKLVVCDPRKNALLKEGNKSDKIDARIPDTGPGK